LRHEKSAFHQTLVEEAAHRTREGEEAASDAENVLPPILGMVDNATRHLLMSLAAPSSHMASSDASHRDHTPEPAPMPVEGWGLFEASEETDLALSLEQQGIALIAKSLLDRFDEISIGSADDEDERSEVDEDEMPEPTVIGKSALLIS